MFEHPTTYEVFYRFGVALAIGLLIGLQREFAHREIVATGEDGPIFAGARTFPLMAVLGCAAAFLAYKIAFPAIILGVIAIVGIIIAVAHYHEAREGESGITTEVAALITIVIGALCFYDQIEVAAAVGVAVTVLLALKLQTRRFVAKLEPADVYATLKFAVISVIILPMLPRTGYGPEPFDVLVPFKLWLMVIFISGISFLGYVLIKAVGARRGVGLTGILGGLASSTAVTLTFSQRSRTTSGLNKSFALAILLAWVIMFVRVLVEVAALNRALLAVVWIPITAAMVVSASYCGYLYWRESGSGPEEEDRFKNPFELGPALTFGLLYAVILVGAKAASMYLGDTGIYLSSIAGGLMDVDAITLSMAELSGAGGSLDVRTAARAVVLAAASNTVVKGGLVVATGSAGLRKAIFPGFVLTLVTALGVMLLI